ncbi:MAG: M14 family zinc carboxypeptidase, partial [Phycisphaerae bacterium]
ISTMHGDEPVGTEMCLYLIDHLTQNYGTDPDITDLVDEIDIWIVPLMNPDGLVAGTRRNANNVDLNRNFPDPFTSPANTPDGREPETGVIMDWSFGESFDLSANIHTGSLVANYPFDTNEDFQSVYTPTPDDDLFIWISEEYSRYNSPMWNSPYFYHGITNGADWYTISGGMQDWSYRYMGCNEVTLELNNTKKPLPSQLPQLWDDNRQSMLSYMETCLIGVRGLVTDATTGEPVDATITVVGRDHEVYTDPDIGDYHRMLLPGTYDLVFEAAGYDPITEEGVQVTSGDATRLDINLWPEPVVSYPNGGETLTADVPVPVTWTGSPVAQFHVQYTANWNDVVSIIDHGFETGTLDEAYSTGGNNVWAVSSAQSYEGSYAAKSGAITHNQATWMTRLVEGGDLSFWYLASSEQGWDFFDFNIDGDRKLRTSGTGAGWMQYSTTLAPGTYELKWEYNKDGSTSEGYDAVWIDELKLTEDNTTWTDVIALTAPGATSTPWTPGGEGTDHKIRVRSYVGDGTYGTWDESDSVFTVLARPIPAVS